MNKRRSFHWLTISHTLGTKLHYIKGCMMIMVMFQIRIRKSKWSDQGRFVLPASKEIGREYFCCHNDCSRTMLRVVVSTKTKSIEFSSPWHPLCCQRPWARAVFFLALRRSITGAISDKKQRNICWNQIKSKLEEMIAVPDIREFWDLKKEDTVRRDTRKAEELATKQRLEAARQFVLRRRMPSNLPECFQILGFDQIPTRKLLRERFLRLARESHPDMGGCKNTFKRYRIAYEEAIAYLNS